MAESLVTDSTRYKDTDGAGLVLVKLTWVSASDGTVDLTTTEKFHGQIEQVITIPDGGGTAPTDQYDVIIAGATSGADLLNGAGSDRSATLTELKTYVSASSGKMGWFFNEALNLNIANAGDSNGGIIYLIINNLGISGPGA